ncbi:MAG: ABC transporter permease [Flavobacteriales bacterium]|nr:ABC transporter permease [Flavobacteriales bacterium]
MGAGAGLRNGFSYNFRNTATNSIRIWGNDTSKPWKGLPPNRKIELEDSDIAALRNAIPGIQHISGQYSVWRGQSKLQYGMNSGSYSIRGIEPEYRKLQHQRIIAGRFINEVDQVQDRKVIVIAEDCRTELFKKEDPLHQWINVNGIPFEVVGLYAYETGGPERGERSPVYIPLSAAQKVFNAKGIVDDITFSFSDASIAGAKQAQERAIHTLARRHDFDPTDDRALWVNNNVENVGTMSNIFNGITAFLWFVGIGFAHRGHCGCQQHHAHRGEGTHPGDRHPKGLGGHACQRRRSGHPGGRLHHRPRGLDGSGTGGVPHGGYRQRRTRQRVLP